MDLFLGAIPTQVKDHITDEGPTPQPENTTLLNVENFHIGKQSNVSYDQGHPYSFQLSLDRPASGTLNFSLAGCVAIANSMFLAEHKWPYKFDQVYEWSHYHHIFGQYKLRYDGSEPINWDRMPASISTSSPLYDWELLSRLIKAVANMNNVLFKNGGTESMISIVGGLEWYDYDMPVVPYENAFSMKKAADSLKAGDLLPAGITYGGAGHGALASGFMTKNIGSTIDNYAFFNFGWSGYLDQWMSLNTSRENPIYDNNGANPIAVYMPYIHIGYKPIHGVQIESLPPIVGPSFTLKWHTPKCYDSLVEGFKITKYLLDDEVVTWQDDFTTGGKGRTTNKNIVFVEGNGVVMKLTNRLLTHTCGRGIYQWSDKFVVTENSTLYYEFGSAFQKDKKAYVELKIDNEPWTAIDEIPLNNSLNAADYAADSYYYTGMPDQYREIQLQSLAGKTIQMRINFAYGNNTASTGISFGERQELKIGKVVLSNVRMYSTYEEEYSVAGDVRSLVLSNSNVGQQFKLEVVPTYSDGSKATVQSTTSKIGTHMDPPTITNLRGIISWESERGDEISNGIYTELAPGYYGFIVFDSDAVRVELVSNNETVIPNSAVLPVSSGNKDYLVSIGAISNAQFAFYINTYELGGFPSPVAFDNKYMYSYVSYTLKAYNANGDFTTKTICCKLVP